MIAFRSVKSVNEFMILTRGVCKFHTLGNEGIENISKLYTQISLF